MRLYLRLSRKRSIALWRVKKDVHNWAFFALADWEHELLRHSAK